MAKTKNRIRWPNVDCPEITCAALPSEPCLTASGNISPNVHSARIAAVRQAKRASKGLLPDQYRAGPNLIPINTDLMHLGVYAPDMITPQMEREQTLRKTIVLNYVEQVELLGDKFTVTVELGGNKTALPDEVARRIYEDMGKLLAEQRLDQQAQRRADRAAQRQGG